MKQLETLSIVAPGFYGLNTQESGSTLSPNFSLVADNVIIDRFGRLGARQGWEMLTDDGATELDDNPLRVILEHVNADNSSTFLSGGNLKLFSGGVDDVLTDITPALYTITDNDWQAATLYDHAIFVQEGHEPVIYSEAASPVAQTITDYTSSAQNFSTSYPKGVIAAYGRFWSFNGTTVYWSTDIADTAFPCFCGGTSGVLNIASVLPNNTDEITALAVHNDLLVIFCKNNVVIYSGANNPIGESFGLKDIIVGIGCAAPRSVQATGNDLIFLSNAGIRSFGRLVQEKSLPMRDLTKNVYADLIRDMNAEIATYDSLDHVCSAYSEDNAFYLLSFPGIQKVYVIDLKMPLQDGAARITTWSNYKAFSFARTRARDLYIGKTNGIGKYSGYTDNGSSYPIRFMSHYLDFNNPTMLKMVKQIKVTAYGGSLQTITIKLGTDYSYDYGLYPFVIGQGMTVAEYGAGEYGVSEYTLGIQTDTIKSSVGGSGNIIQVGFEARIDGNLLSIQSLDCFVKTGRNI